MAKSSITINDQEVLRALRQAGIAPRTVLRAAVAAAAEVVLEAAQDKAPGPHIEKEMVGDEGNSVTYDVGPAYDKWHYRFFERGTGAHRVAPTEAQALHLGAGIFSAGHVVGGVAAQPFLRPAIDENKDKAANAAGKVFKGAIE